LSAQGAQDCRTPPAMRRVGLGLPLDLLGWNQFRCSTHVQAGARHLGRFLLICCVHRRAHHLGTLGGGIIGSGTISAGLIGCAQRAFPARLRAMLRGASSRSVCLVFPLLALGQRHRDKRSSAAISTGNRHPTRRRLVASVFDGLASLKLGSPLPASVQSAVSS